jgi:hypothetical protein
LLASRNDLAGGPDAPAWTETLLRPFGRNPFGENIFRVVWSTRRVFTIGGYFEEDGMFRYSRRLRYPKKQCWILERWLPARHYGSPETWKESTINPEGYLSLGPYPLYGLYECCFMFAPRTGLHMATLMDVIKTIWTGRTRKISDIREQLEASARAEEAAWDAQFEADYDSTHGVRRGLSVSAGGALVNYSEDIERYKEKLIASGLRVKREDFKEGFAQLPS